MKTVRVENGIVIEIIPNYALPVEKWYGKSFASQCMEAPDEVNQNWIYDAATGKFSEPVEPAQKEPEPDPVAILAETVANLMYQMDVEKLNGGNTK